MRKIILVGVAMVCVFACGVVAAQEGPASGDRPAPAAVPRPPLVPPQTAFDLQARYFFPSAEVRKKLDALRLEWAAERNANADRMDQELDARFGAVVVADLDDKQKADFARLAEAVKVFWAAAQQADKEYIQALGQSGVSAPLQWLPDDPVMLLHLLPRVQGQPSTLGALVGEYQTTLMRERAKAREAAMAPQDADDKTTPTERHRRAEKADADLVEKLRAEFAEKALAAVKGSPQEKTYSDLLTAQRAWQIRKTAAREALLKELPETSGAQSPSALRPGPQGDFALAPRRSVEIVARYLTLTREQQAKLQSLRADWDREQQQMRGETERALDARYADRIAETLEEPQKGNFKRAYEAISAYRAAVSESDAAWREAYAKAGIRRPFWPGVSGMQMATALPGLSDEQQRALSRLSVECTQAMNRERSKAYESLRSTDPAGPPTHGPAQAAQARQAAEAAERQVDAEYVEKALALLGDTEAAQTLRTANEARLACAARKKALLDTVTEELKTVIGEDRLWPRPPAPRPPPPPTKVPAPKPPSSAPAPG